MSLDIVDIRATSTRPCKNATTLHISKRCQGRLLTYSKVEIPVYWLDYVVDLEMVTCRNGSALSEPRKLKWFRKQRMNFSHVVSTNTQYILRRNSLCLQGRLNKVFYIIYDRYIYFQRYRISKCISTIADF